jgi:hypothetical protein
MLKTIFKLLIGSLIITLVIGSIFFTQLFDANPNNLSKIYFYRWRSIPFNNKATTFLSYVSNDPQIDHIYFQKIRAKARGGGNADFPKHNFTIELTNKHQLAGLKNEDDWILGASFLDKSFIRHKLSFDLFRLFNSKHKAAECEFIEIYRNFKYHGLYVIMERMDGNRLEINKKDSTACIFKEPPIFIDPKVQVNSNPEKENDFYHQKFPDLTKRNKTPKMQWLREFIAYAPDSIFDNEILSHFNLDDIIDWHILLLLTHNSDGVIKGFYLYKKDDKTPFKLAVWDYDNSFGRDTDNEPHLPGIINWERNILLNRLVNSNTLRYKIRLKQRFFELVEAGILTTENLTYMIDKDYVILKDFAKKNEELWPIDAEPFYDDADFEDEVQLMKKWIPLQLKEVSEYISRF